MTMEVIPRPWKTWASYYGAQAGANPAASGIVRHSQQEIGVIHDLLQAAGHRRVAGNRPESRTACRGNRPFHVGEHGAAHQLPAMQSIKP
jgi:hypothetical protein